VPIAWTTETREAAVTECLVKITDGEVNVGEALEILARGVGRKVSIVH
jgi:hypothetical protein